jgi:hypothetical protein
MSTEGRYLGGIRTIEDIRQRCRISDETGCWHWGYCKSPEGVPRVHFVLNGVRQTQVGRRAVVMLKTGQPIPRGHVAFPTRDCHAMDCLNPEHCRSGTRANYGQFMKFSGRSRSPAKRAAALRTIRDKLSKLNWQDVRSIRASDEPADVLAERYKVGRRHIFSIKAGRCWKENLPQASVFTFRPAMKEAA